SRPCYSLRESVLDPQRTGIIAEYKRASPSKGLINGTSSVQEVVRGYEEAGASAVSVLTDADFFQGSLDDLTAAREVLQIPVLRKEFIVDTYQIAEAKAYGADVILLIAACLTTDEIDEFSQYAKSLGLSVLLEVHNAVELNRSIMPRFDAKRENKRNLTNFTRSFEHSNTLVDQIPDQYIKVSESVIADPATIRFLESRVFHSFLIGENFIKTPNPMQ